MIVLNNGIVGANDKRRLTRQLRTTTDEATSHLDLMLVGPVEGPEGGELAKGRGGSGDEEEK